MKSVHSRLVAAVLASVLLFLTAACNDNDITFTADTRSQMQLVAGGLGGRGESDGAGSAARFIQPRRIAVAPDGTVFMEDHGCRMVKMKSGQATTLLSMGVQCSQSSLLTNQIVAPADGSIVYTLSGDSAIHRMAADGTVGVVHDFADGSSLGGLAVAANGDYYVHHVNVAQSACDVTRLVPGGSGYVASVYAGGPCGSADGAPGAGQVDDNENSRLKFDSTGRLHFAGYFGLRTIATDGTITTSTAAFGGGLRGLAIDRNDNVYVVVIGDLGASLNYWIYGGSAIWKVADDGTLTFIAGTTQAAAAVDGTGAAASFSLAGDLAADPDGNLWVPDEYAPTVRLVTPAGVVTTAFGGTQQFGTLDGRGSAARFALPQGLAVDAAGNAFVADYGNCLLRKIDTLGRTSTVAGSSDNCTAAAASDENKPGFGSITQVAVDTAGHLFAVDGCAIRRVGSDGSIAAFVGQRTACTSQDGTGTQAGFGFIEAVVADPGGNLYVFDAGVYTVRKITPAGVVSTLAGTAGVTGSADGVGPAASFGDFAWQMAADAAGNLYLADAGNHAVRRIDPNGVVTTLAGSASAVGNADGVGTAASFTMPMGIAVSPEGDVLVLDVGSGDAAAPGTPVALRRIAANGTVTTLLANPNASTSGIVLGAAPRLPTDGGWLAIDASGGVLLSAENSVVRYGVVQ